MSLAGNLFLALGIVLQISSKTLVQPGEGIVLAIAVRLQRSFGDIKVRSDIVLVCLAAILGFGCSRSFIGLREGTLISALLVGFLLSSKKYLSSPMKSPNAKLLCFSNNTTGKTYCLNTPITGAFSTESANPMAARPFS